MYQLPNVAVTCTVLHVFFYLLLESAEAKVSDDRCSILLDKIEAILNLYMFLLVDNNKRKQ